MFRNLSIWLAGVLLALPLSLSMAHAAEDARVFELRVYTVEKGKQADVNALIAGAGVKGMAKQGIEFLGAFVPVDAADERIFTVVAHKDRASADKAWPAFQADAEWKTAREAAMKNGKIVTKIEQFFLSATDYSPKLAAQKVGGRVFELRTYATTPNNLPLLNARFRDHTMKLFEKHGMTNVVYWNLPATEKTTVGDLFKAVSPVGNEKVDVDAGANAAPISLVYFLAHKSPEAAKASFDAFRQDADWVKARTESEVKGGGSLTAGNGVKSLFLKATSYSPVQ